MEEKEKRPLGKALSRVPHTESLPSLVLPPVEILALL